jgi:hypothetical protein
MWRMPKLRRGSDDSPNRSGARVQAGFNMKMPI